MPGRSINSVRVAEFKSSSFVSVFLDSAAVLSGVVPLLSVAVVEGLASLVLVVVVLSVVLDFLVSVAVCANAIDVSRIADIRAINNLGRFLFIFKPPGVLQSLLQRPKIGLKPVLHLEIDEDSGG